MEKIVFECESITPMFMYGADGKTPELRPASIKGVMRFWWRAINGNDNIEALKQTENEIFGNTDKRSKVIIRIGNIDEKKDSYKSLIKDIEEFQGIKYNFYPIFIRNDGKSYFKSLTFDLIVSSNDEKVLESAIDSLIMLNFFGALGSRSRRGAGSISIKVKENKNNLFRKKLDLLDINYINNKNDLKIHINKVITVINPTSSKKYTTFYKKIFIFDCEKDWKLALDKIVEKFADFRKNNKSRVLETPNFGFPVRHKNGEIFIGGIINKKNKAYDLVERRASPLIFKVLIVNDNCFFPIIVWLEGDLLPSKEHKIIKKPYKNNPTISDKVSDKIINEFINQFNKNDYIKVEKNG